MTIVLVLVVFVVFLIFGYIFLVKVISKNKPKGFPIRNIVFGWAIILLCLLTTIFSESGHVLTLATVLLRLSIAVLLSISYVLMMKQKYRMQTLWLLLISLLLFIVVLWEISSPNEDYFHTLQRADNICRNLAIMVGGSMFIWYPMWYLARKSTREHYDRMDEK